MKNVTKSKLFQCSQAFAELLDEEKQYLRALEIIVHVMRSIAYVKCAVLSFAFEKNWRVQEKIHSSQFFAIR